MVSSWFRRKHQQMSLPCDPSEVLALRYLRVSTRKQEKGFSPEAQQDEIDSYIRERAWERGPIFRDTLQGTRDDRPGYQQLLQQVRYLRKQGRSVVVVAAALDRTGRDLPELLQRRKELTQLNVHFITRGMVAFLTTTQPCSRDGALVRRQRS